VLSEINNLIFSDINIEMINARTKYMAQLVAEAFNVQEYEASVS
jgi:hypothetical protein